MTIACKIFRGKAVLLAACDRELLGRTLKHGEADFEIKESFYFEKFVGPDELKSLLKEAQIANLVGERAFACSIELGLVNRNNIKLIDGVSHVQVYRL
ncbi:MAG: DUF424 domain-containing protein [Candidatus Aenigmatarchaeota archaeon]